MMDTTPAGPRDERKAPAFTDYEVELIRRLHEVEGWGYGTLAKKFETAKSTIQGFCIFRRR